MSLGVVSSVRRCGNALNLKLSAKPQTGYKQFRKPENFDRT
jgi:hypothetical protein